MSTIKLYSDNLSQPCRAVKIFLLANNIQFDIKFIDLTKGEQKSKNFRDVNPLKKVPVVDDDGFIVTESVAILRYLCHSMNCHDHWYPEDAKLRARVDEYLSWHHLGTCDKCYSYIRFKTIEPMVTGRQPDQNVLNRMESKMNDVLDCLEKVWLKNNRFLIGDDITIADLLAATELEQLDISQYDPTINHPILAAWLLRVKQTMNPHYEEVHKRLKYYCKLMKETSSNLNQN